MAPTYAHAAGPSGGGPFSPHAVGGSKPSRTAPTLLCSVRSGDGVSLVGAPLIPTTAVRPRPWGLLWKRETRVLEAATASHAELGRAACPRPGYDAPLQVGQDHDQAMQDSRRTQDGSSPCRDSLPRRKGLLDPHRPRPCRRLEHHSLGLNEAASGARQMAIDKGWAMGNGWSGV